METERTRIFSYRATSEKEIKNLEIFDLLCKKGGISRTEISKATGINMASVSNYVKNYIGKSLVLEKGLDVSSGGRKPELVELNKEEGFVVGMDVSRCGLKIILADMEMNVIEKIKMPGSDADEKDFADRCAELISEIIKKANIKTGMVKAIGAGVPDSRYLAAAETAGKKAGAEIFIGGHAACAALGERYLNPDISSNSLLYIYSDLGRGIVIKQDRCIGAVGDPGELRPVGGKVPEERIDDFREESKYLNPWNEHLGIAQAAKDEVSRGLGTMIVELAKGQLNNITDEVVIEAARQNDELAANIINSAGLNLGLRIAYLINLFTPEIVAIGGGLERAGDLILDPIRKTVKKLASVKLSNSVKIIPGRLGDDAVSLGAALLAVREIFIRA